MSNHHPILNTICLLLSILLITACTQQPPAMTTKQASTQASPPSHSSLTTKEKPQIFEFTYHHFKENENVKASAVTRDIHKFEADLQYLKAQGYNNVTHKQIIDHFDKGAPLPEKPYAIRFDDGYLSNYTLAFPIIKKYNAKVAICIIGVSVGVHENITPHFSWQQAREMVDSGLISIQNHSYDLHKIDGSGVGQFEGESLEDYKTRLRTDFTKLNDLIYQNVGNKPYLFAYPNGVVNDTAEQIARECGFTFTTARPNILSTERDYDKYNLTRLDFFSYTKVDELIKTAQ
ncbi:Poly-beta-1,6-N-acetyl-D-glucosamine N-deacetylase precursor [Poriferisphaera corsica]|uniref:Poly-beta-1,6-N-acetyl-D-glucosamine N-deacetylase n=1 Tax=Poriferisphaera corsica TaxID=2528020 RepID=A0A517YSE0_9BACT|nr:polysaccharide deacetylase family protein [Poriferisphaera corsica]QDU33153.1 Poly-beta-1,6-N-acetyl-D-glucosamine N-deacetylase precursor [Poriferisphaera corsica]